MLEDEDEVWKPKPKRKRKLSRKLVDEWLIGSIIRQHILLTKIYTVSVLDIY